VDLDHLLTLRDEAATTRREAPIFDNYPNSEEGNQNLFEQPYRYSGYFNATRSIRILERLGAPRIARWLSHVAYIPNLPY